MEKVKQTGLLFKFQETDYTLGSSPVAGEVLRPDGDWRDYLPKGEKQKSYTFDTMSCTTFSALNILETLLNFFIKTNKVSASQVQKLKDWGYLKDGDLNFSDRFTAVMSNTTENGNYFQNVWDSIRKDGLLPEADFPFEGSTWKEYHDKTKITDAMRKKAKMILEIFSLNYVWVQYSPDTTGLIQAAMKESPVHAGVPFPAHHAIELPKADYIFDSYSPYLSVRNKEVHFAMKILMTINTEPTPETKSYKYFSKAEVAKWKLKHELWLKLDELREKCGFPFTIVSGLRTKAENAGLAAAVSDSAHLSGLAADISCTDSARRFKLVKVAQENGVTRIGIGKSFVHLDIDTTKPSQVMWHYY